MCVSERERRELRDKGEMGGEGVIQGAKGGRRGKRERKGDTNGQIEAKGRGG